MTTVTANANVNAMPPRTAGSAPQRAVLVTGAGDEVGVTTVTNLVRCADASAFASTVAFRGDGQGGAGQSPQGAVEIVQLGHPKGIAGVLIRMAQATNEGGALIDLQAGLAQRVFTEARAAKLGRFSAKAAGLAVVVVVGPTPSSVSRARELLRLLREGAGDIGVSDVVVCFNDFYVGSNAWDSAAHRELTAQIEVAKMRHCEIPYVDLAGADRFGFVDYGALSPDELAARLGVNVYAAGVGQGLFTSWLATSTRALRATGLLARAQAKAA